jgi:hypothetical protein
MINSKSESNNLLGRLIFLCLFLLLISILSDHSVKSSNTTFQSGSVSAYHSKTAMAVINVAVQLPSYHSNLISQSDKFSIRIFNKSFKLITDNSKIFNKLSHLQKNQLIIIKPSFILRFYHYLCLGENDDSLILS